MQDKTLILAQGREYSLDCRKTQRNNNVLVVGASGSGKTRSIVIPNLMQASGNYIVSDPKGDLYYKYGDYLRSQGYEVKLLDFTDPARSENYNFFHYIRSTQDIIKIAHMIIYQRPEGSFHQDPFWDEAAQLLLQSLIAYLWEEVPNEKKNLRGVMKLMNLIEVDENDPGCKSAMDILMENLEEKNKNSLAAAMYKRFRIAAGRTLKSILITVNAKLAPLGTPEIEALTRKDTIDITSIGRKKTALFVGVSDTDRSLDGLVNIFFTQAMNELCTYADRQCPDHCLPVPVRFILDDFATNCTIVGFPRMISSIRSRGISVMLMIQAESQLTGAYDQDGRTIIGNCDTYVYLGGNDVETAQEVARRCDVPLNKILNMPVGTNWILRRGEPPYNGENFRPEAFLAERLRRTNAKLSASAKRSVSNRKPVCETDILPT